MTHIRPTRFYANTQTGKISPLLYQVVNKTVTVKRNFSVGNRQGTWRESPFKEIVIAPPSSYEMDVHTARISRRDAPMVLFMAVCDAIERTWQSDKLHIVFHSSGNDSRIISGAIKRLLDKNGKDWLGKLTFISNSWEADQFKQIMELEQWSEDSAVALVYNSSKGEHFRSSLDFETYWAEVNAPAPIPGNLWSYLLDGFGAHQLANAQAYAGLYANETWKHFCAGGLERWNQQYKSQYYWNILAVLPFRVETHLPLTDVEVLKYMPAVEGGRGQELRELVADLACPNSIDVPKLTIDDRGHKIAPSLRKYCEREYSNSWYGQHIKKNWKCPQTSEFSDNWGHYGLASLCEALKKRGVNVKV